MRSYFWIFVFLLTCSICFGQSVSIGAIGGGMLTNDLNNQGVDSVSSRYVIGPQLDIGLPLGFAVEVDALYRHESYQLSFAGSEQYQRTSWEFPFLLKKTLLPFPVVKPFVEAGYAPRTMESMGYPGVSHGLVIGGGVEFRIGRLRLSPAVRYTHWDNAPAVLVFSDGPTINLTQNQVDALVGISWKLR